MLEHLNFLPQFIQDETNLSGKEQCKTTISVPLATVFAEGFQVAYKIINQKDHSKLDVVAGVPIILALGRMNQENDHDFKASLGYVARPISTK